MTTTNERKAHVEDVEDISITDDNQSLPHQNYSDLTVTDVITVSNNLSRILSGVYDQTGKGIRLQILALLTRGKTQQEIISLLNISSSHFVFHIKVLESAGLVNREGRGDVTSNKIKIVELMHCLEKLLVSQED